MFSDWKQEKTITALIDEAQALADRLDGAKPHVVESHAAAVQFWAARYLADGQDLHDLPNWTPQAAARLATALQVRIGALRKARAYDSSDGLAIWLHTARAVSEPRIVPPLRRIWQHVMEAGSNADFMAHDQMQEEGLPLGPGRRALVGFG